MNHIILRAMLVELIADQVNRSLIEVTRERKDSTIEQHHASRS